MEWLVIEDISGDAPRLEAMPFDRFAAMLLIRCANVRSIWRVVDDSKELAVQSIEDRLMCDSDATRRSIRQDAILEGLQRCGWNVSQASVSIGIDRKTIYRNIPMDVLNNNRLASSG